MLLFYTTPTKTLEAISTSGIKELVRLATSYEEASKGKGKMLVINPLKLGEKVSLYGSENLHVDVKSVPAEAIENLNPYLSVKQIIAGGGYVLRKKKKNIDVLMIYRKGTWDLPKGKLDPGESIEECAMREVREEVGIRKLSLGNSLGTTVHGYERKGYYWVKTTYWYVMKTPEEQFKPQLEEKIEEVRWMPWDEAVEKIGYEIFRQHMKHVASGIRGKGKNKKAKAK